MGAGEEAGEEAEEEAEAAAESVGVASEAAAVVTTDWLGEETDVVGIEQTFG